MIIVFSEDLLWLSTVPRSIIFQKLCRVKCHIHFMIGKLSLRQDKFLVHITQRVQLSIYYIMLFSGRAISLT